jgi:hypothetical protein
MCVAVAFVVSLSFLSVAPAAPPPADSGSQKLLPDESARRLIQPGDLKYLGAFRLPDEPEDVGWTYSGTAMTYYPDGDPDGPDDGFPGSIFGLGHEWHQYVSEISIPVPVVSSKKDLSQLNTATTLQKFGNVRGELFGEYEMPRAGLAYLPKQGQQKTDKLYYCWAPHLDEHAKNPSHIWCELDLSNPRPAGPWRIGDYENYTTADYIFPIPKEWADANTPGKLLATGRFRDGGQGGQGPSLFAFGPWNEGNPPEPGAALEGVPLLLYSTVYVDDGHTLRGYSHSDEWSGGAWLTAGGKSAVVFVGNKGQGKCWYGFPDGVVWPNDENKEGVGYRGWWSDSFKAQIIFYDPDDLAQVAKGEMETYAPQPYATLEIGQLLFRPKWPHEPLRHDELYPLGGASFDRERGLFYVFETRADGDKSLVHVWRISAE